MPKQKAIRLRTNSVRKKPLRDEQEQYRHSHALTRIGWRRQGNDESAVHSLTVDENIETVYWCKAITKHRNYSICIM